MKRSEINKFINEARVLFETHKFHLPPFAYWSPEQWQGVGSEAAEIRENGLGWDVTDYGLGRYEHTGLLLFTIRNGNYRLKSRYPKGYAEKIMMVREAQITPWHFHWNKREDIINRGGGNLVIELYRADDQERFSDQSFGVSVDGVEQEVVPGGKVILEPGQSICLEPYVYHTFYGQTGGGSVMVGEVSDVNDDSNDNRFYEKLGRFPTIEEDEPPQYLLCTEYPSPS
ncbi:MAG: D-lyxose/D-mannose family sugar isomerase [Desulfobulbaceae bacterium]|nr:MAG: D-lyxose/D-mannose family sugar isomerase [Desulfobulbaceae bacterium]